MTAPRPLYLPPARPPSVHPHPLAVRIIANTFAVIMFVPIMTLACLYHLITRRRLP